MVASLGGLGEFGADMNLHMGVALQGNGFVKITSLYCGRNSEILVR